MGDFRQIQNNSERIIPNLQTEFKEFKFLDSEGFVPPNVTYSVYYTNDKIKIYLTGLPATSNTRRIEPVVENDIFVKYQNIKNLTRENYPKPNKIIPNKNDYEVGIFNRYFTQKANGEGEVFEISKETFDNKSSLYLYYELPWVIAGNREDVRLKNILTINTVSQDFPQIRNYLDPLQYWRPLGGSRDDVQKKLSFLKN